MDTVTVLIAETDRGYMELLRVSMEKQKDIKVICTAGDGRQALQLIEWYHPQIVVFNMLMPKMDGLALLEALQASKSETRPRLIALSSTGGEKEIARAEQLGVDDYMLKPVDASALISRIRRLGGTGDAKTIASPMRKPGGESALQETVRRTGVPSENVFNRYTAGILLQLGMPAHLSGYSFLIKAVAIELCAPGAIHNITNQIYPEIAKVYNTTPSRVERSIRHAVNVTWTRGGNEAYFKLTRRGANTVYKPTNTELIAQLAEQIRMRK